MICTLGIVAPALRIVIRTHLPPRVVIPAVSRNGEVDGRDFPSDRYFHSEAGNQAVRAPMLYRR